MYYSFVLHTGFNIRNFEGEDIGDTGYDSKDELVFVGMYDKTRDRFFTVWGMEEVCFNVANGMEILKKSNEAMYWYGYKDLQKSKKPSLYVRRLQIALGFTGDDLDGYFGDKTYYAVVEMQKEMNLSDDGIVGTQTKNALYYNQGG